MRDRLDVAEQDRVRHQFADALLDLLGQLVRLRHRPQVRHQQVEGNEAAAAGPARQQGVKVHAVALAVFREDLLDLGDVDGGDAGVQQAPEGAAHQQRPGPDDVHGHSKRDQRVEDQPAGGGNQRHAGDDADGSPDIRHQVMAVAFQRDAVPAFAD